MKPLEQHSTILLARIALCLAALGCGAWPRGARGDGGTVQLTQETSGYRITVFTAPTPIRVGLVDVSVLVQDAETGNPMSEARVSIHMAPRTRPNDTIKATASHEAATNKLLQAAMLTLSSPGRWDVVARVEGPQGPAQVRFEIEAAEPLPEWRMLWPWFSWPAAVVLLFGAQQFLSHQRSR